MAGGVLQLPLRDLRDLPWGPPLETSQVSSCSEFRATMLGSCSPLAALSESSSKRCRSSARSLKSRHATRGHRERSLKISTGLDKLNSQQIDSTNMLHISAQFYTILINSAHGNLSLIWVLASKRLMIRLAWPFSRPAQVHQRHRTDVRILSQR